MEIMHTARCTLVRYHRHNSRGLVAVAALEAGEAPVDKLDGVLGLDGGVGGVAILVCTMPTQSMKHVAISTCRGEGHT